MAMNYSKWDRLEVSDDEDDVAAKAPIDPLLEVSKTNAARENDRATATRFADHMQRFDAAVPSGRRGMAAHFIAVSDRGVQSSNTFRHPDIISCCTRYGAELLSLEMVSALCELHKRMVDGAPSGELSKPAPTDPLLRDAKTLMEAINTLEACRRVPNVTSFFEAVCQPSRSDRAKELATIYQQLEFGKRAMMRHIFKTADGASGFADTLEEEEAFFDARVNGKPPPGSSSRSGGQAKGGINAWSDETLLIAGAVAFLAVCVGLGAVLLKYMPEQAHVF